MARLQGRKQAGRSASVRWDGGNAMNSVRHIFLIATAVLVLTFWFAPPSLAQSSAADELNKSVIELNQAGRYAEAVPLAQQVLTIREKALGPDHPDVATALSYLALLYWN
jgi:hypothetical protein